MPLRKSLSERRESREESADHQEGLSWWILLIDANHEIVLGAEVSGSAGATVSRICAFHGGWTEIWADEGLSLGLGRWRYRSTTACEAPWYPDAIAAATPNLRHWKLPRGVGGALSHTGSAELEFTINYTFSLDVERMTLGSATRRRVDGTGTLSIGGCSLEFSGVGEVGVGCHSPISSTDLPPQVAVMGVRPCAWWMGSCFALNSWMEQGFLAHRSRVISGISGHVAAKRTPDGTPFDVKVSIADGAGTGASVRSARFHSFTSLPGAEQPRFILCSGAFVTHSGWRGVGWFKAPRLPVL